MTRIGVLSDTHIPKAALDLPKKIYQEFQSVDMILHAGDLVAISVLERLQKIAPTYAVRGNMDMPGVSAVLPIKDTVKVDGFKIGLIHGWGPPSRLLDVVSKEFNRVDVIVFGHSHAALCEKIKNTLFLNPGSPTDKIFATYNSFGILEIAEGIGGTIIRI